MVPCEQRDLSFRLLIATQCKRDNQLRRTDGIAAAFRSTRIPFPLRKHRGEMGKKNGTTCFQVVP